MTDLTLLRAQGKLVILLAAMLQAEGIKSLAEFAAQLAVYAVAVADDEPAEGEILAYWAGMLQEILPPADLD